MYRGLGIGGGGYGTSTMRNPIGGGGPGSTNATILLAVEDVQKQTMCRSHYRVNRKMKGEWEKMRKRIVK